MSEPWKDVLFSYDFWNSDGCSFDRRGILVADSLTLIGDSMYEACLWSPEGISSTCASKDFLRFQGDCQPQTVKLLWDIARPVLPDTKYVLFHADMMPENVLADFAVDSASHVLPLLQDGDRLIRVVEMFAGGVGGNGGTNWQTILDLLFGIFFEDYDSPIEKPA